MRLLTYYIYIQVPTTYILRQVLTICHELHYEFPSISKGSPYVIEPNTLSAIHRLREYIIEDVRMV